MFEFWKQMFRPSPLRKQMESAILRRAQNETITWQPTIETAFANSILQLIEVAADWPRGKLRPTDPVLLVFHGKSDSDLAFSNFAIRFYRAFGVKLTQYRVLEEVNTRTASIEDFVIALSKIRDESILPRPKPS
jgi:hypothetical protein